MIIRDAVPADAPGISAIWNPVIRGTAITFTSAEKSLTEVTALITNRQTAGQGFLVMEDAAGLAGFATYAPFRGGSGYRLSMELTIQLAPRAQGRGLGRALMRRLEDHARHAGVHVMVAGISGENPRARAFHEALGYSVAGTLPEVGHKFGRFMDLWLLQKILT